MWQRHWSLSRNPFDERRADFVATSTHVEAVGRLVQVIESADRSARLVAGPGLGKSRVLAQALKATRSPTRRVALVSGAMDSADLFSRLAQRLGGRVVPDGSRSATWRALAEALRLCRWQGIHAVLAVDDAHVLESVSDGLDLERLDYLDPDPSARLTVLRVSRSTETEVDEPGRHSAPNDWDLSIQLLPLTRSESSEYLAAKLRSAGRTDPAFTPRALSRIHSLSRGIPRGLDRLAALTLMVSAVRGLEIVSPEIVDEAAREFPAVEATTPVA
jgi:MSHA biogenesis protein MshM